MMPRAATKPPPSKPPPSKPSKTKYLGAGIAGVVGFVVAGLIFLALYLTVFKNRPCKAVACTPPSPDPPAPSPPPAAVQRIVAGYAPLYAGFRQGNGWFAAFKINPALYTHLLVAFADVTGDGTLTLNDMMPIDGKLDDSIGNVMKQYTALRDGCSDKAAPTCADVFKNFASKILPANRDLKVMISVGGWNASGKTASGFSKFHDILVNAGGKRKAFVDSCVAFVTQHKLDGVDLDIECPGAPQNDTLEAEDLRAEKQGFTALVQTLGAALHAVGKLLTFAAMVGGVLETVYEWKALSEAADFINLMTYDFHGSPFDDVTGPNTPLWTDFSGSPNRKFNIKYVIEYIVAQGVDPAKLVLGLASYGRTFPVPQNPGSGTPYGQSYQKMPIDADGKSVCMQGPITGAYPGAIVQTKDWDVTRFGVFSALSDPVADLHAESGVACGVGLFTLNQGSLAFYEIMDLIQAQGPAEGQTLPYRIDETTATAYAYITSGGTDGPHWSVGGSTTQVFGPATVLVSFDTFETLASKCQFALAQQLGGVMIWSIGEDDMFNGFALSAFVRNYVDSEGHVTPSPSEQQAAYLKSRTKTPVTCSDECYIDAVVVGDNWSTPGALSGLQQIGTQNCGCTWDWPRVANLTPNQTGCSDACETLTPDNTCYLHPGEVIQTAGIKGAKDTCKNFYSTRYPLYSAPTPAPSPQPQPTPAPVPVQPAKRGPNYCGTNWGDADAKCDTTAQSCVGTRAECPAGQDCYETSRCPPPV